MAASARRRARATVRRISGSRRELRSSAISSSTTRSSRAERLDPGGRSAVAEQLGLDPAAASLGSMIDWPSAGALLALDDGGGGAVRQFAGVRTRATTPTRGGAAVDPGHEEDPAVAGLSGGDRGAGVVGVEREGGDGAGEDHAAARGAPGG